ncbi:alpha-L-rhamnosidase [Subtercola endophyticus]|uniref:alpha-L-rhamnosidase n=1 Tax=Subtercola endophyticus TaxID=2895559 RepID=UPI001E5A188B|nr:alpha-L-rhamnosidase [Subtercola endophyticus]UFS60631.1 glycoside hydrolase family 78 protein [Subtercola endophyticus]
MTPDVRVTAVWAAERGRPEFLATGSPSLSWRVETQNAGWLQGSAEVQVQRGGALQEFSWASGASQNVGWFGAELAAYETAAVRVRVRGLDGSESPFSEWAPLLTGPLSADDFSAAFITVDAREHPEAADEPERGTQRFRALVTPRGEVTRAVLSATAHGVYEIVIGGTVVGDQVLAPGWTSYDERLTFQSYDVTALVTELVAAARRRDSHAPFVLGATVAQGWYGEMFGFDGNFSRGYAGPVAFAAQLRLEYADGSTELIVTDEKWSATRVSPVVSASIYQGETYDARLADAAFADSEAELPGAAPAQLLEVDRSRLEPAFSPPVRRIERVAARELITTPSGKTVIDFGQNLVGWLELRGIFPAGHTITLRHAEVLEHGELGVRALRFAGATDRYTGAVGETETATTWSPAFTFHGFRYAEIGNWPGELGLDDITAIVVHSDMVRTGYLSTSNAKLNQLHENVLWGMRGNFLSLPTDCPQRDERLGWTGDIQVFSPTASYLYDVSGFLGSWLRDLRAEQLERGGVVPVVVPDAVGMPPMPAAAWGDAASLVPATLYERFGDNAALAEHYPGMRDWVDVVNSLAGDDHLWTGGFQFGDWLDPSAPPENPAAAKTDSDIVATAYFYRSALSVADAARVLGRSADEHFYRGLAESIRVAFVNEYVTPAGRMLSDAHTAYALALGFGLLQDAPTIRKAGARLAELVRSFGYRIGTGFVGTPLICDALCIGGESDTAFRLLLEEGLPSWLYPIAMGATTIWERWDSMLPDGSINPGEMTSFNHYALGAVADWMHRTIGGIAPAEPGYRVVDIKPILGGGLTRARASLDTGYGTVEVDWMIVHGSFELSVSVPPNTRARVMLPGAGGGSATSPEIEVGSGIHHFTADVSALLAPAAKHPYSLKTSLSEIVADAEAVTALEQLFASQGYFIGLGWTKSGKWKSNSPLGNALIMYRPENLPAVEQLLQRLNAR